jgi:Mg/Co/Ni transporter MgtE
MQLTRKGHDPAMRSSILLTATMDSMGFLILGLASPMFL